MAVDQGIANRVPGGTEAGTERLDRGRGLQGERKTVKVDINDLTNDVSTWRENAGTHVADCNVQLRDSLVFLTAAFSIFLDVLLRISFSEPMSNLTCLYIDLRP